MLFTVDTDSYSTAAQAIISAGSSPFVLNITCKTCYDRGATITVYATLLSGSPAFKLRQDANFVISSLDIKEDQAMKLPASVNVTFSGLAVDAVYTVIARCANPPGHEQRVFKAPSTSYSYFLTAQPAHCASSRFVTIASSNDVQMAVAEWPQTWVQ